MSVSRYSVKFSCAIVPEAYQKGGICYQDMPRHARKNRKMAKSCQILADNFSQIKGGIGRKVANAC